MPIAQVFTALIEAAANKALMWSSNSGALLAPLSDKTCIIYVQEIQAALLFRFSRQGIQVSADIDGQYASIPDDNGPNALNDNECWVSLSIFAIDKLKQNNQMTKLIKSGKLDFSGNLAILQGLSHLFDKLDIDLEELLSGVIGDGPAYQVNSSGKKLVSAVKAQLLNLSHTFADAALDEKPIGVRLIMVLNFSDEVNSIRADVDRLDSKLTQLEAKFSENQIQGQSS